MKFSEIAEFIGKKMQMQHIYQPVMLMTLMKHGGHCSDRDIAKALLPHDESQIDYYTAITNNMVGRILRKHKIVEKDGHDYRMPEFNKLSEDEIRNLTALCKSRLEAYKAKAGLSPWIHRKKSSGYISGTLRYEVFKRARFRCESCGIKGDERALEVDHIVPRNKGGANEPANYQALCYVCNAMKRDRDDTDFRQDFYAHRESGCLFCNLPRDRKIVAENALAFAIEDKFPVTPSHTLVIPKRHAVTYFDLRPSEVSLCNSLIRDIRAKIQSKNELVTGFNIGINSGEAAGQSVFHCHIHLFPRCAGDVANPRGGVRHMIPGKGNY